MLLVLPVRPEIKSGEDGKTASHFYGNVHINRDVGRSLYAKMTELLQSGDLKVSCARTEILYKILIIFSSI